MGDYASRTVTVSYGWKEISVRTEVEVPYGRDGSEVIDFVGRLIAELTKQRIEADVSFHEMLAERSIGPFGQSKTLVPRSLLQTNIPESIPTDKKKGK
jgi:hypothetical protein